MLERVEGEVLDTVEIVGKTIEGAMLDIVGELVDSIAVEGREDMMDIGVEVG